MYIINKCLINYILNVIMKIKRYFQVGPSSSGKTSMVQVLASLSGRPLNVLHMNSEMDTTELLGGFEQVGCSLIL